MTLPLNTYGEELVGWYPRHLQSAVAAMAYLDMSARELERLDDAKNELLDQMFVQTATWGLPYWEGALQLPVDPVDELGDPLSDEDRRTVVLSRLRANVVQSAAEWRGVIDTYVTDYMVRVDHTNGIIYLSISYNPGAYSEGQLETLIRSITPAHYDLNVVYTAFLADISAADDPV